MGMIRRGEKSRNFFSWVWCHWKWPCDDTSTTAPPKRYQIALKQPRGGGQCTTPAPQPRQKFPSDLNDKRICLSETLFKLGTASSFSVHESSFEQLLVFFSVVVD